MAEELTAYKPDGMALLSLFKGDPGTAKSPAAASYPEPYILDLDGRIASIASYWGNKEKGQKIKYDTIVNNYPKLCEKLESLIRYNPFGTIVLDSVTTLARSLHTLIFEARGAGAQVRAKEEGGKARLYMNAAKLPGKFEGIPVLEIDDYKTESTGIIQILDACRVLWNGGKGCNVIVIAHVIEVETKDILKKGAVTRTRAIMTGGRKIAAEIPVYFNEAYHFYNTPSGGFEITTKSDGEDWAKTSLPLPERIDFTHQDLYELVDGYRKGENP